MSVKNILIIAGVAIAAALAARGMLYLIGSEGNASIVAGATGGIVGAIASQIISRRKK